MRKLTSGIFICLIILLSACKQTSIEKQIEKTFKEFADTTFYALITLARVVAIEPHDSITVQLFWIACAYLKVASNDLHELI